MRALTLAFLLQAVSALSCSAALTVHSYSGLISDVSLNENGILGAIQLGDAVSGYFTFDPDANAGGDAYDVTIAISIGSRDIVIESTLNFIRAQNDISVSGLGIVDRFRHGFDSNGPTTILDPLYVYYLSVEFIDTSATVFDGTQELPVDLNLTDYDVARWSLGGADLATRTDDFRVTGTISSVSIPEPGVSSLLAVGGLAMLIRNKRGRSTACPPRVASAMNSPTSILKSECAAGRQ